MRLHHLHWGTSREQVDELVSEMLAGWSAQDRSVGERLVAFCPVVQGRNHSDVLADTPNEEMARLTVAREHNFESWGRLVAHVSEPPMDPVPLERMACISYFPWDRADTLQQAEKQARSNPSLGTADIYVACCVGDTPLVAAMLDKDPSLVNRRGGFFDWEPLLYACYSRLDLPGHSTFEVARLLLERGAHPNAFFMWGGQYRFTALTGAFGEGERGPINQPPHPQAGELARMLLTAGADPNDSQALYNQMFTEGSDCLKLLLSFGLKSTDQNNWLVVTKDGRYEANAERVLDYQLRSAIEHGHDERAVLLLQNGANPNASAGSYQSLYEAAVLCGSTAVAQKLLESGARKVRIGRVKELRGALMREDKETVNALLAESPSLLERLQREYPNVLAIAAQREKFDAVKFMLEIGIDVRLKERMTALHQVAYSGHLSMVKFLLEHGADIQDRDLDYAGTPLDWARQQPQEHVIKYLSTCSIDIFDAVSCGNLERLACLLEADLSLLEKRFVDVDPRNGPRDSDWETPLARAVLTRQAKSVIWLMEYGANPDVTTPDGWSLRDVAKRHSSSKILEILSNRPTKSRPS